MSIYSVKPPGCTKYLQTRSFTTSRCRRTHYETLGIPEGASKSQIKSHFYKLSKQHHPDVSKDPESQVVFRKASEAYAVLSNDRERRAYDRSLLHRPVSAHTSYHAHAPSPRSPKATYAWETRRAKRPPSDFAHKYGPETGPTAGRHYTPPNVHSDVLSGIRLKNEQASRERDKIDHQSQILRTLQVFGVMTIAAMVINGYS